ncbi:unnamed protein product [marine sediment metagenome]|uniref:Uncharacterized protein n=1 Tax=marine sediment metagenome TaxID=412755 RepID=X1NM23_9ZZZZ
MSINGYLTKSEKIDKEKELTKAMKQLQNAIDTNKPDVALEALAMTTIILVQWSKDHELRLLDIEKS